MGYPMDLVFSNPLEMLSFIAVALAVNAISQDGETTWFEGVLLLGVYVHAGAWRFSSSASRPSVRPFQVGRGRFRPAACENHLSAAAALRLLHAGNLMVRRCRRRVILPQPVVDRETILISRNRRSAFRSALRRSWVKSPR